MLTVSPPSYRYERSNKTAHTMAKHFSCIVLFLRSESLIVCEQDPIGTWIPSCCVCSIRVSTFVSQTPAFMVYCPFMRGRTSIGGFVSAFLSAPTGSILASVTGGNVFGSSLRSFLVNEPAAYEEPGRIRRRTLRSPTEGQTAVWVKEGCSSWITSAVAFIICSCLGRMNDPGS